MGILKEEKRWYRGIIQPVKWDDQGHIQEIQLALPNEINMKIVPDWVNEELKAYPGTVAKLLGRLTSSHLVVEEYKIIKPFKGENK